MRLDGDIAANRSHQRRIKGSAAKIINQKQPVAGGGVFHACHRGRNRFLQQADLFQPGHAGGGDGCFVLHLVEGCWHGDNRARDRFITHAGASLTQHFADHRCAGFDRADRVPLRPKRQGGAGAKQPFEPRGNAFGRNPQLIMGAAANTQVAAAILHHNRWEDIFARNGLEQFQPATAITDDNRVGGAKVNAKIHDVVLRGWCRGGSAGLIDGALQLAHVLHQLGVDRFGHPVIEQPFNHLQRQRRG